MTHRTLTAELYFNRISGWTGSFAAVLLLLLVANVFYDVVMRYLFNDVSIGMQELEWHLYSMIFLFGVAYTLGADGHVRVDILYEHMGRKKRALIDILGTVLFLWPFCILVAAYGIGFAYEAYDIKEMSGDPGGLPFRWLIKSMISASFICVLVSSVAFILRAINSYRGLHGTHRYQSFRP